MTFRTIMGFMAGFEVFLAMLPNSSPDDLIANAVLWGLAVFTASYLLSEKK